MIPLVGCLPKMNNVLYVTYDLCASLKNPHSLVHKGIVAAI